MIVWLEATSRVFVFAASLANTASAVFNSSAISVEQVMSKITSMRSGEWHEGMYPPRPVGQEATGSVMLGRGT